MSFSLKRVGCVTAVAIVLSHVPAYAEPSVMFGLAVNFGSGNARLGATAKVLTHNEANKLVGAGGVTYFFDDRSLGFDAGVGYTVGRGAVTLTYDFTNQAPQVSIGFANAADQPAVSEADRPLQALTTPQEAGLGQVGPGAVADMSEKMEFSAPRAADQPAVSAEPRTLGDVPVFWNAWWEDGALAGP